MAVVIMLWQRRLVLIDNSRRYGIDCVERDYCGSWSLFTPDLSSAAKSVAVGNAKRHIQYELLGVGQQV